MGGTQQGGGGGQEIGTLFDWGGQVPGAQAGGQQPGGGNGGQQNGGRQGGGEQQHGGVLSDGQLGGVHDELQHETLGHFGRDGLQGWQQSCGGQHLGITGVQIGKQGLGNGSYISITGPMGLVTHGIQGGGAHPQPTSS
ncbi:hypothetical protein JTB14_021606 [Gonioctena quinquepunctata]|nr:hypothetical protein JTB14_021606 [Gonioctena quinquepunctata]